MQHDVYIILHSFSRYLLFGVRCKNNCRQIFECWAETITGHKQFFVIIKNSKLVKKETIIIHGELMIFWSELLNIMSDSLLMHIACKTSLISIMINMRQLIYSKSIQYFLHHSVKH